MDIEELILDLAPFADLGEEAPSGFMQEDAIVIRMTRGGDDLTIKIADNVVVQWGSESKKYKSLAGMLASPIFADLSKWADSQKALLSKRVAAETLPVNAVLAFGQVAEASTSISEVIDRGLTENKRNTVLLVDGPAGIGKTALIRKIAHDRARDFRIKNSTLVLHVESRGRVLQNIADLMAFSLQSMRLSVTYDQIPTLVKYGLITLAIDGFDELGDPDGYDLAWAQLNELIERTRNRGSYVLSGRETFISETRIRRALPVVEEPTDLLDRISISHISPAVARSWLAEKGWSEEALSSTSAAPIFAPRGYALRPFFLNELATPDTANDIYSGIVDDTLSFLIGLMLQREQKKFGVDVEAITTAGQRKSFLTELMEEVARDLAENHTDAMSSDTLAWLSDAVSADLPRGIHGILRNRADVVAFLTNDDRRGYKKFVHEELQNYFLASVTRRSIVRGEIPKYIRRNILGMDFLESFSEVMRHDDPSETRRFLDAASASLRNLPVGDRGRGNLASLIISCSSVTEREDAILIQDANIDECYSAGIVSPLHLERVTIGQIDARDSDLRQIRFEDCHIVTMIGNDGTVPSQSVPRPAVLALPDETVTDSNRVEGWLGRRFFDREGLPEVDLSDVLGHNPLFKLLLRLSRYKPFWLKTGDDKVAKRILEDESWPILVDVLRENEALLERDDVPAAGRKSTFFHLRNKEAFISLDLSVEEVRRTILAIARLGAADKAQEA